MKKIITGGIISLVAAGLAVNVFLWLHKTQIITLPDGTKLTLLGVDYGKHHKYPAVKTKSGVRRNYDGPSSFDTTNDTVGVWILQEHKANQWENYDLLVCDAAETACVASWSRYGMRQINPREAVSCFQLDAFPRWERKLILRVELWGNNGQRVAKEQFVVSNPARGKSYPKWTAESVPDTQSDGDLDVTLTKFVYGVPGFGNGGRITKDPMSRAVLVAFHTEQKGVVLTNWEPIRIETSDATGNDVLNNSWSNSRDDNGDATMTYQWGLWPGQTPWKLRVEMSQSSGFKDDELWTVQNVPVNPGSQQDLWSYPGRNARGPAPFAETTLNGIHLKLFPVIQFRDQSWGNGGKPGGFRVQADQNLDGMQLTLLQTTDENGRGVQNWGGSGWGGDSREFQLQDLRNTKSLNLTLALHKSRFVEFTANPQKAEGDAVQ